jgi:hypothetical protein
MHRASSRNHHDLWVHTHDGKYITQLSWWHPVCHWGCQCCKHSSVPLRMEPASRMWAPLATPAVLCPWPAALCSQPCKFGNLLTLVHVPLGVTLVPWRGPMLTATQTIIVSRRHAGNWKDSSVHLIQSLKISDIFHQVLNFIKHLMKNIIYFYTLN